MLLVQTDCRVCLYWSFLLCVATLLPDFLLHVLALSELVIKIHVKVLCSVERFNSTPLMEIVHSVIFYVWNGICAKVVKWTLQVCSRLPIVRCQPQKLLVWCGMFLVSHLCTAGRALVRAYFLVILQGQCLCALNKRLLTGCRINVRLTSFD